MANSRIASSGKSQSSSLRAVCGKTDFVQSFHSLLYLYSTECSIGLLQQILAGDNKITAIDPARTLGIELLQVPVKSVVQTSSAHFNWNVCYDILQFMEKGVDLQD